MAPLNSAPLLRRTFSTTCRNLRVSPESPRFIDVPKIKLPETHARPRQKGVLPQPKKLFPASEPEKGSPEYIAAATKEPTREHNVGGNAKSQAIQKYNAEMAAMRRKNLREGLTHLKEKKEARQRWKSEAAKHRKEEREAALHQAMREDVRLTLPSVLSTLRMEGQGLPDPNRETRLAEMKARNEVRLAEKKIGRRDMLHELYMKAGDYILTSAQLDKAIDEAFRETDTYKIGNSFNLKSISQILVEKRNSSNTSELYKDKAIREVAGALTGGKLPPSGLKF